MRQSSKISMRIGRQLAMSGGADSDSDSDSSNNDEEDNSSSDNDGGDDGNDDDDNDDDDGDDDDDSIRPFYDTLDFLQKQGQNRVASGAVDVRLTEEGSTVVETSNPSGLPISPLLPAGSLASSFPLLGRMGRGIIGFLRPPPPPAVPTVPGVQPLANAGQLQLQQVQANSNFQIWNTELEDIQELLQRNGQFSILV